MKNKVRNIHMVGIGGVGMSGIAEMLQRTGYHVSGSDVNNSNSIQRLTKIGVKIMLQHDAKAIKNADVLVYSSAIDPQNVELMAARKKRIPIISRAEMLAELMRFRKGIAIAGTHGKTTTTSLVAVTLSEAKFDPTYVVGGILNSTSSNARLGKGEYIVAEADESDASFLQLQPVIAIVTNIDLDHMGAYSGDPNQLYNTFIEFLHHLPFYGFCVLCTDDPGIEKILPKVTRRIISYGFNKNADYRILDYRQESTNSFFSISQPNGTTTDWQLSMPGKHNALNALASIIIADELEIDNPTTARALATFPGVHRRFSVTKNCQLSGKTFDWVDDYAHHPKELDATWEAVDNAWKDRDKIIIFQPHRYSRTRDLFDDFVTTLSNFSARLILLTEVYAATESRIPGADSESLIKALRLRGMDRVILLHDQKELNEVLPKVVQESDVVVSMGAGSISSWMKQLTDNTHD